MRTAIVSALLAVVSVSLGTAAAQQQQKAAPATPPQSISPMVPVGPVDTDPAKMAGAPQAAGAKPPGAAPVNEKTYIIGPEDVLRVIVLNQPGMTSDYPVRPDGRISIPLAGEISVGGLTPEQVNEAVTQRLKDNKMILDPHVYCEVMAVHSKQYFISGEVGKPGRFDLVVPTRVSEALAQAGGFKDFAKTTKIRIVREAPGGQPLVLKYNEKEVSHGKHLEQNIFLQPGDRIYVD